MKTTLTFLAAGAALICASTALAQDIAIGEDDVMLGQKHYSPYLDQSYPNRVFFGDTHLHTSYSTDAGMIGNTLGPDEAFRFARGEKVRASVGEYAQLIRPLDFLVVADHAENLGMAPMIAGVESGRCWPTIGGVKMHDLVKGRATSTPAYVMWGDRDVGAQGPHRRR